MNITRGKIRKAQKVVIYGSEGIGKSTFASQFPDPLFIDTEGSTNHLDVARMDSPSSWEMLAQQIKWVHENKPCKTLVIDTADWAEKLCSAYVVATRGQGSIKSIEEFGYGKGYTFLEEEFVKMLHKLQELVDAGINVVITAHAIMRKFEQPDEMGAYDRWELKLHNKRVAPLIKEWADMVLFANYKTLVIKDSKTGKSKGQGGHRVMYTTHSPVWDAKNRHDLPEELEFSFESIKHIFNDAPEIRQSETPIKKGPKINPTAKPEQQAIENENDGIPKALADLMKLNNVTESEIQAAVAGRGYYPADTPIENYDPAFVQGVLIGAWEQVFAMIQENREEVPF